MRHSWLQPTVRSRFLVRLRCGTVETPLLRGPDGERRLSERLRKAYRQKLKPTPDQERQLEVVLWRCRTLYNVALEQRKTWWQRGEGKRLTRFQQEAELKDIRAAFPEYAAIHS